MTATDPKIPVKQLRELLQEQQEPFILELCLVERGYLRNSFNAGSSSSFPCCHGNSRKSLKSSFSFGLKRTKKGITYCPKVLRSAYNQVISFNERLRTKVSNHRDGDVDVTEKKDRNKQEAVEIDRFSSASSSTVFNSCCGSDAEETSTSQQKDHISFTTNTSQSFKRCKLIEQEAVTDRKLQWQCIEESRQLSPVSVLEEVASHTECFCTLKEKNTSKTCVLSSKKVTEDSILSASLWKIFFHSATEKPTLPGVSEIQELVQSNLSSHHLKSRSCLQQTKQLLFDCVREIVENQGRKEKEKQQQQQREYLASEELGKLIGEKIKFYGKQYGEESTLRELLELEFQDSAHEWRGYEPQRRDIGFQIGDAILEEISSEMIKDMIDFLSPITRCSQSL
ncbi:hypothetical protein P3X46_021137 [Hevea brasiliensis]|uniref:DUF4378 domain-containing protein n=1 Tax=Hevea brasiliensis TaxID=3981 RepID=A0ABQ9LEH7_HEVBR|nr:uncharacterized protein LOC110669840 isoform X2 [Hevea brasiliensis]KAJ9166367.1 hypothetical protein P3X46_021137 [Hevea brasiliensis]